MDIKLSYGLRNGKIVSILDIDSSENGLKCGCICPACHKALMAKGRDDRQYKRQPHFAHTENSGCSDRHAQQTALHLLAKEIIEEGSAILLPGWGFTLADLKDAKDDNLIARSAFSSMPDNELRFDAKVFNYSAVGTEVSYGDIIADAVISVKNKECLVEIYVTHAVDDYKAEKARTRRLPMFEIDLSEYETRAEPREVIKEKVLNDANRRWIYSAPMENALEKAKTDYRKVYIEKEREKRDAQRIKSPAIINPNPMNTVTAATSQVPQMSLYNPYRMVSHHDSPEVAKIKKMINSPYRPNYNDFGSQKPKRGKNFKSNRKSTSRNPHR